MSDPLAQTEYQLNTEEDIDPRILELSREYLASLRAGLAPVREEFAARLPELREEVEEYLEGIELAFTLEKANRNTREETPNSLSEFAGEPIGDFHIVQEIGRGGMGVVYEAVQISLGRSVALKVLPFAAALDDRHRKRFLLEAQAAAQLHHNHIVPVYAVGCERGTHYYAMQLIDGQPISAELFDQEAHALTQPNKNDGVDTRPINQTTLTRSAGTSSSGLSTLNQFQQIAKLIADAAEGLEYAHSCGIVHRDVKPANLLLDTKGKIWIADFGLAQITSGEHVTQTGDMLGTMRYMSPEQASGSRGVVDHRSDVYSLGATLYELLTKQNVFDGQDRQSLLRQVLHEDPKPLRQIDRNIPEELETITLKALRHAPSDRYESAQHFADDLRRYLAEIPITARRPSISDQLRKWMRRHPTAVISALLAMIVTMISLAVATCVVMHQKSLTQQSLAREQLRATQAEKRLATAQAAADEMISMAQNEFTRTPMEETLRLRLLSSALTYYQALLDDPDLDAPVRAELTRTFDQVAKIHDELKLVREDRRYALLADESVLADLGLSEPQRAQLRDSGAFAKMGFSLDPVSEARERQRMIDLVLSAEQKHRLQQIAVQLQGPSAIIETMFSGDLNLSDEQAATVQTIFLDYLIRNAQSSPQQIPTDDWQRTSSFRPDEWLDAEMKQELLILMLRKLTPQQREAWSSAIGREFKPQAAE